MYKLSSLWAEYYRELEPARRRKLLKEALRTVPDDGANAYRYRLLELRHTDPEKPGHEIDLLLWQCVNFIQVYASARFFKKRARKDVERSLAAIGYDEAADYGEAGAQALYWELRNGARRYFTTCLGSEYHRVLFGLMSAGENDRTRRIRKDVQEMTTGLSERLLLQERLSVWNRAVQDEFLQIFIDK